MWILCLVLAIFRIFYARVQYAVSLFNTGIHMRDTHLDQNVQKQTDAPTQKNKRHRDTLGKHEREPTLKMFTTLLLRKYKNFSFKNVGS